MKGCAAFAVSNLKLPIKKPRLAHATWRPHKGWQAIRQPSTHMWSLEAPRSHRTTASDGHNPPKSCEMGLGPHDQAAATREMAASMVSTAAVAARTAPAQATMVAPFTGLKSAAAFPSTRKNADITTVANNGGRVSCMKVWPTEGLKKFETLSYLPPLTREQLIKEIEFLIREKLVPCLEFELKHGFVYREYHASPGYYDGRYWTMWKLPMFGCTDPIQVLKELDEVSALHPNAFVRIIGFNPKRQVQIISFIAHRPPGY